MNKIKSTILAFETQLGIWLRTGIFFLDEKLAKLKSRILYPDYWRNDIYIHPGSRLGNFTQIGRGTNINGPCAIFSSTEAPCKIGKFCAIGHNLRIRPRNHYTGFVNMNDKFQNRYGFPNLSSFKGSVTIGNNCWIADNVIVLGGVTIGDGAVVGASAVVTKDVPAYTISAGIPARVIKKRFSDSIIRQLAQISWWDWTEEKIRKNKAFFEMDLRLNDDIDLQSIIIN